MDIEQAIEYALSGRSVLFVGAGFSIGAKTLQGSMLKTGKTFAKAILNK